MDGKLIDKKNTHFNTCPTMDMCMGNKNTCDIHFKTLLTFINIINKVDFIKYEEL